MGSALGPIPKVPGGMPHGRTWPNGVFTCRIWTSIGREAKPAPGHLCHGRQCPSDEQPVDPNNTPGLILRLVRRSSVPGPGCGRAHGYVVSGRDTSARKPSGAGPCRYLTSQLSEASPSYPPTTILPKFSPYLSPHAYDIVRRDSVGKNYRLGPAPYKSSQPPINGYSSFVAGPA